MQNLYQIFYPYNKFDTKEKIELLKKYMYSETTKKIPRNMSVQISEPPPPKKDPILYIEKKNSMFWSIYISIFGYESFQYSEKQSTIEMSEKQKIIDFIKENPKILKTTGYKITNTLGQEILSDLMTMGENPILFIAYAVYYKINIVVFFVRDKQTKFYLEIVPETHEKVVYLFYDVKMKKYGVELNSDSQIEADFRDKLLSIENFQKPLKAISHYKMSDLQTMAMKLGVSIDEKKKKEELYTALIRETTI
jgi:hypothetical protein